jgi:hypothetical protein
MLEIALGAVGSIVGFVAARRQRRKPTPKVVAFRHLAARSVGYRESAEVASTVGEVGQALRRAGLPVRERGRELVIARRPDWLRIVATDPGHVTLASLDAEELVSGTLIWEVALALIPVFGPLMVTEAAFGAFVVDGSRDHLAIDEERKERIRAIARAISEDMSAKLAVWRGDS